jgi:DNA (cytosine-5)-methyltransferase 1
MPTFIDLFCGAGGFTQGLKSAGWTHVAGIELDKHAAETYAANHGADEVLVKDVRKVTPEDLRPFFDRQGLALAPGALDAIVASPPCTSFSRVGPRKVGDDRDTLYKEAVRLARALKPRWVVMENVVGMLSKRDAKGVTFADRIARDLRAAGYSCQYRVLEATSFGVPQRRRRVIFVAARDGPGDVRFPPEGVEVDPAAVAAGRVLLPPGTRVPAQFRLTPEKVRYYLEDKKEWTHVLDPKRPAPTVRASYLKSRGQECLVSLRGGGLRLLTPLEMARLQGFPDDYRFPGSMTQVYKQIGNAVAPPMARGIALALAQAPARPSRP